MLRHLLFRSVVKAFHTWKRLAAQQAVYRQKVGIVLKRFTQLALFAAFDTWGGRAATSRRSRELMRKVAARFTVGALAAGFARWVEHWQQIATVRRVLRAFTNSRLLKCFHNWRLGVRAEKEEKWRLLFDSQRCVLSHTAHCRKSRGSVVVASLW